MMFHPLDFINESTDPQVSMFQSEEHATAVQKVPSSSLGHSILSLVKI